MTDLNPSTEGGLARQAVRAPGQGSESPWQGRFAESWPLIIVIAVLALALGLSVLFVQSRIVVAVVVLLVATVLMVRHPYIGLLLYFVILYGRPAEIGVLPGALHVERVVAIILVVAVGIGLVAGQQRRLPASRITWAVFGLLAAILASVPFAYWRGGALAAAVEFAKLCFLYFSVILLVRNLSRARVLLWLVLLVWAWHGLSAWVGYHAGTNVFVGEQHIVRAMGPTSRFGDANTLGYLLVVGLCFVVGLFRAERSVFARVVLVVLGLVCFGGILMTGSRTAAVGVAAVALLAVWQTRHKLLAAGLAVVVLALGWMVTPESLRSRYETLGTYQTETTWVNRQHGWLVGARMFAEHPLFGVGAGNFGAARYANYERSWLEAHSVYTQVAAELGFPGIICFGVFVALVFRENRRLRRKLEEMEQSGEVLYAHTLSITLSTALAMLLVLGITGHNMYNPNYYLVAGLTVALGGMAREWREDGKHALRPAEEGAVG